jgi:hypothetical protein
MKAFTALLRSFLSALRAEGKPMQAVQMSGPGVGAIPITSLTPEENEKRIAELLAKGGMA